MDSQIAETRVAVHQIARGLRDHDLPSVSGSGDPRGSVDVDSHIALGCYERLTGVNSDAHANRALGQPILPFTRRLDSIAGPRERVEERIALRVHLDSAALCERVAQDPSMFRQNVGVLLTKAGHEGRRPLDIGEDKGDGSGR